jgi:hypothetical protein
LRGALRIFDFAEWEKVDGDFRDAEPDTGIANPRERVGQSTVGIP